MTLRRYGLTLTRSQIQLWRSTGIDYSVTLDAAASRRELKRLHAAVDKVAEIPRAIRAGASVIRSG
ncbi:MAG: hypothetical protein ACXVGC_14175 [Mycobacteriaceae bacterium]